MRTIIKPFRFIWRQLQGPQITAIMRATFVWLRDNFEYALSYFADMSIDTANTDHLSFLGLISGFSRAVVAIPNEKLFWFTYGPMHNNEHGFSDLNNPDLGGGRLSDAVEDRVAASTTRLPINEYRRLLKAYTHSEGNAGSLVLLDDLTKEAWDIYQERDYAYSFVISEVTRVNVNYGDIVVRIGNLNMWADGQLTIRAVFDYIENSFYKPEPRLILSFTESDSYIDLENGHDKLQAENGDRIETEVTW